MKPINIEMLLSYSIGINNSYSANEGSTTVSVIETVAYSLSETITVGDTPRKVEHNPSNNNIYVSNSQSDDVSVIQTVIPPPQEGPKTIADLIESIIQNPLDITNSIESANEIIEILTDDDRNNDQLVCELLDPHDRYSDSIGDILNC